VGDDKAGKPGRPSSVDVPLILHALPHFVTLAMLRGRSAKHRQVYQRLRGCPDLSQDGSAAATAPI
jgi:hypothetical protein